jgi:hypothetical protein
MAVKSSFCCECVTGYGVLVEIDAVRLAALRGEGLPRGNAAPRRRGLVSRVLGNGWRGFARAFAVMARGAA